MIVRTWRCCQAHEEEETQYVMPIVHFNTTDKRWVGKHLSSMKSTAEMVIWEKKLVSFEIR